MERTPGASPGFFAGRWGAPVEVMDVATELMQGREYAVESADVLNLALSSSCSAYDCEFIALAQELGAPLVTTDRRIRRSFGDVTSSLVDFGTDPR